MGYSSRYPVHDELHVKATTTLSVGYYPYFATDPTKSVTGAVGYNSWAGQYTTNQRFHIDLGAYKLVKRIYYENNHDSGASTDWGARDFTFWGTNDATAFADLTFSHDTNWTQLSLESTTFEQHVAANQADPKYILVTNTVAYRYYAIKILNNWGNGVYLGFRRIELQVEDVTLTNNGAVSGSSLPVVPLDRNDKSVVNLNSFSPSILGTPTLLEQNRLNPTLTEVDSISLSTCETMLLGAETESSLDAEIPLLSMSSTNLTGDVHSLDIELPIFTISLTNLPGQIGQLTCKLPFFTISSVSPNLSILTAEIPIFEGSIVGHGPLTSTLEITLPMLEIFALMARPGETVTCFVLNTETGALSQYTNFDFNSFCIFNGHNLAACSTGIYLLEGDNDDGTDIDASFSPGINDFENAQVKRMLNAYVPFKGDGQLYLKVTSDDGIQHEYILESVGERTRTVKTKIGKGKKGRWFETEIANIGGTDFEIQEMLFNIELLKRKVG